MGDCRGQLGGRWGRRQVIMPLMSWAANMLQWPVQWACDTVRWSESLKAGLSSDWGLQLDPMKVESLVIADQQRRGEYVPGPCTHRPSRHESRQHPKLVAQPFGEGVSEGGAGDWDEVVTR